MSQPRPRSETNPPSPSRGAQDVGAQDVSVEVRLERPVAGGMVLGRDEAGRVVLSSGGIAGERVVVELDASSRKARKGTVAEVLEPSPARVEPPCRFVRRGCGGCDLQHLSLADQTRLRLEVVADALGHLGGFTRDEVEALEIIGSPEAVPVGDRTTVRMAVDPDGVPGFRRARTNEPLAVGPGLVAHELLQEPMRDSRFPGSTEVQFRASVLTGEVLAVPSGGTDASGWSVPGGVEVVPATALKRGARRWITESVAGVELRVSAESFFQSGPVAAGVLTGAVRRAVAGHDLVQWAEELPRAFARVNTAGLGARVTRVAVESWTPSAADVVVADPARSGLGRAGVEAVCATGADLVVLVSCDPASMARDLSQMRARGWEPQRIEVVDMFPHTHHVEAVSTLARVDVSGPGRIRP